MFLFAQNAFPLIESDPWLFAAIFAVLGLFFLGFCFWLQLRYMGKNREFTNLERLKSIECGQPAEPSEIEKNQDKYLHNVFWIAFWVGGAVPIAASSAVSSVMIQTNLQDFNVVLAMWICVAIISVSCVICATVLMVSGWNKSQKIP